MLDGDYRHEAFEEVVADDGRVLFLDEIVLFGVLVYSPREGGAEAGLVGSAVRIMDRVGVGHHLGCVTVIVLNDNVERDVRFAIDAILSVFVRPPTAENNGLGM